MHASTLHGVLDYLRKLTDPARSHELSDADLLDRFRLRHEEAAFTLLVQRHGPMVLNVCRRILGDAHEAEDAFQATFLVLVRKAAVIRKQQSLAGWLHRVASRLALRARLQAVRRQSCERQFLAPAMQEDCSEALAALELRAALDEEIERLPDKYRTPIVLCYFAEKTHEQAARELGCPKSSVTARLARARELLQRRLRQRGFTVPAGLLAVLLTEQTANAAIPSLLTLSTVRLAVQTLAGETLPATSAATLAGSFVKNTTTLKLGAMAALVAMLGVVAVGYRMAVPASSSSPEQSLPQVQALGEPPAAKPQPRLDLFGDPLPDEAIARMGSGRLRFSGNRSLFFSADGKQLIATFSEGLRICDVATGKLQRRIDFPRGQNQTSCRYIGDSLIWAIVGDRWSTTVQILDAATGRLRRQVRIKEPTNVANPTLAPDGKRLAVPHRNDIGLYDTTTGQLLRRIAVKGVAAWSIAFSPDGKTLAFNDLSSDTIYFHDADTGKLVRELKRPGDTTLHLVFSPDGRFLASMRQNLLAQEKGTVSIWNVREGKEVHRLTQPFPMAMSAAFSPDGKRVAVGGARWGLVLWDVETGKEVRRLSPQGGVVNMVFSPDGKTLATASHGVIRLWDAATGKLLPASADLDVQTVHRLRFSSDGKRLSGESGACLIWDPATGRELQRFADPLSWDFSHPNDTRCLVLSPDESLLAVAHPHEKTITVWDAATGKKKCDFQGDEHTWKLAFTPDSRRLISTGGDNLVRVWDVEKGRELYRMSGKPPLAVSPDGRLLAAADAKMMAVFVYDLTTGKEMKRFAFPQSGMRNDSALVFGLAFAPDGRSLAAVGYLRIPQAAQNGIIRLWDLTESERVYSFEGQKKPISSVAFSPDGRTLATGGSWGELILWEVNSGHPRHSFTGHESGINALAFSSDGRTLAASSVDAPVYVWDVAGILQFKAHRLSKEELQRCWAALAGEDASAAFQAIRRLAVTPEQAVPFLREHLKPVPAPDEKRIRQLVEMLDSADFPARQKASEDLENQGDAAAAILRKIVAKEKPSLEVRRRLQQIVQSIEGKPESLRALRAVEVLEWTATPDAVRLLGELANGADARLTREAAAAKQRLQR